MKPGLRWITEPMVDAWMSWPDMAAVLDHVYSDWAQERAVLMERTRVSEQGTMFSQMGGFWFAQSVVGSKAYTTFNGQFNFLVTLFGLDTGQVHCAIPGQALTRWRTAGQTALVARKCLGHQPVVVAVIGAGLQGTAHVEALTALLQVAELRWVDPHLDVLRAETVARHCRTPIRVCTAQEAVQGADLVVTATRSLTPVFDGRWLSDHALVCAVGTSSTKGTELDACTLDRAHQVWVESQAQSAREAGELAHWPLWKQDHHKVRDLPQLYKNSGFSSAKAGLTVFKAVGNGLADTAAAWWLWQQAQAMADEPIDRQRSAS